MDSSSRPSCGLRRGILILGLIGAAGVGVSQAAILNDGTTTNGLVRLSNLEETAFGNTTSMRVDASGTFLVAEQIDLGFISPFPALRTVWYSGNATVTSAVYRVSAEYRPAAAIPANQGGVMGWINAGASNGILLKVVPAPGGENLPFSFQLSHVDFTGTTPVANENFDFLYNLDGTPAFNSFDSGWSDPTNYVTSEFAQFELEFSTPTAEDLQVVTNATARVTGRVYQGEVAGTPTEVGRVIELLTTLPVPPAQEHRVGYYGVWSSFLGGDLIGDYRNLTADGGILVNLAPTVELTQPGEGASLFAPATFQIEATASDPDGSITQVEFFEGTNSLGRATSPPYAWSWSGVPEGNYILTAVATDNQGGTAVSIPVMVSVVPNSGTVPTLTVEVSGGTIHLAWTVTGYLLQYKTNLDDPKWIDVPDTSGVMEKDLPTNLGAQYFRLVGSGVPTGPRLSVSVDASGLTVSWPANVVGYRLQTKDALDDPNWTDVPTTGDTFTEAMTGTTRFYRLTQ